MAAHRALHGLFINAAERHAEHIAVVEPEHGSVTYRELAELSNRVRDRLCASGVQMGDRVGIYMRKSIEFSRPGRPMCRSTRERRQPATPTSCTTAASR
jgi:acyl-CoA synthetase (AMP-forming)/AMP-acid ligase II